MIDVDDVARPDAQRTAALEDAPADLAADLPRSDKSQETIMTFATALAGPADEVVPTPIGSPMQLVDINLIEVGHRIRALDYDQTEALKESIVAIGLLNPITVRRCQIVLSGETVDGFRLIAGAHRLAACRDLGHTAVPVVILDVSEPQRIIAECDENLCGTKLSPTERAEFTDRRKRAYEALHPETVQHVAGGKARQGAASDNLSFAEATAASTGKTVRSVQRDAARAAKVGEDVRTMVKRTKLDTGAYLDGLIGLSPEEQKQRVQADLKALGEGPHPTAASPAKRVGKSKVGKTSAKWKSSHLGSNIPAHGPSRLAWLLEEMVGYTRAEITGWLTEPNCKEAIKKANAYADSAAGVIRHFQATHAKAMA
jgi:ParB family chromosome partitioning protein